MIEGEPEKRKEFRKTEQGKKRGKRLTKIHEVSKRQRASMRNTDTEDKETKKRTLNDGNLTPV